MIFLPFFVFYFRLSRSLVLSDAKMIIVLEFFTERDLAVIKELKINCFANSINL